ncbi:MAG: sodium:solute symporter [Phycisphaeraceae bacterium]|nr:MAG: sodium:solute symporter [Phycisphaeraceae bacterium]
MSADPSGSTFGLADWLVVAGYFALLAGSGAYFAWRARRQRLANAADYFTAGHAMPVWAVAVSILATAQSAATFTGVPEQSYTGNLAYLATNLGGLVAAFILAGVFIPAYYRRNVTTPYQLLETRLGRGARLATSWAYMIGRVFASGSRVFVGAIPVSIALFGDADAGHMAIAVSAFMAFGIVYTLAGGITSVIWTDVLQVCVYLGAAVLAVVLLASRVEAPWGEVLSAVREGGPGGASKLELFPSGFRDDGTFHWGQSINLVTILTGFVLLTLASHGADQDLVQRMLTTKSASRGSWSVISGVLVGIPAVALFLVWGLLLWVLYQRPELMSRPPAVVPKSSDVVVLTYILHELPAGAAGLMIAGVMAAGPAGINAGLNSMASTFVTDVYRHRVPGRSEAHYLRVSRLAVVGWGVVLGAFALLCIPWKEAAGQTIIDFVLGVMNFAYAGLLGVFLTALFTRRGNSVSAVAALVAGALTVLAMRPEVWRLAGRWWTGDPAFEAGFSLAWPWHLITASAVATAVCCLGRSPASAKEGGS